MWQHKIHKDFKFPQNANPGGKTFNSGVWSKKLKLVADNKIKNVTISEKSRARATYILNKRDGDGKTSPPVKGMSFYPFEEYLPHHICETIVIINTGSPLSFFDNPFVKNFLKGLNPRHRMVYRTKLAKLLRCVTDVSQKEASTQYLYI